MIVSKLYSFFIALTLVFFSQISIGATITVNSNADNSTVGDSFCTLREAITTANTDSGADCGLGSGADTINFNLSLPTSIVLTTSLAPIEEDLTVTGPGAALLEINANAGSLTVFTIGDSNPATSVNVTISGLNISNANLSGVLVAGSDTLTLNSCFIINNTAFDGGGIDNFGTLTLNNSIVSGNTAVNNGGGISNRGTLTLNNSIVRGNSAFSGGGIYIDNTSTVVTIANTTIIEGNTANDGGGLFIYGSSVSITTGSQILSNSAGNGGGIYANASSSLIISESEIDSNAASTNGAGIYTQGPLTLSDSTLSGNAATGNGGAILHETGGAITLSNCTIGPNNYADQGAGIYNLNSSATVTDCAIYENTANFNGGGLLNSDGHTVLSHSTVGPANTADQGGGILNGGTLHITNSTISGNSTTATTGGSGGGLYHGSGSTTLNNVTITNNTSVAAEGGGLFVPPNIPGLNMQNSIIAGNSDSSGTGHPDCSGTVTSNGFNLIGDSTGCMSLDINDLVDINAGLGALADNSGPTQTHALQSNSAAIDAGNSVLDCLEYDGTTLTTDQRGNTRPVDGNRDGISWCDIGAFEYSPSDAGGGDGGFCFIATAAYGSYLHPHVQSLRDFRDQYLLTNSVGRKFVHWYYKNSPPVADTIAADDHLRTIVRWSLSPVVFAVAYPKTASTLLMMLIIFPASLIAVRTRAAK